ncbi:MAG: glycosyltransferase [Dehalococcoidia bacterium]|nr:MAG: glycosyltransferase [Dehalococcoidia bacterium]
MSTLHNSTKQILSITEYGKTIESCPLSVVIVTYKRNNDLVECLNSLQAQSEDNFEIIVVDNGNDEHLFRILQYYNLKYIRLRDNFRPSMGRNIGTEYARGDVVCFLDDDGIADTDFIKEHLLAYDKYEIIGLRGRILPRTDTIYNYLQSHYDFGNDIKEFYISVEGNCSFKRDALLVSGGFDTELFGGEGLELSFRLVNLFGREKLIYYPKAIIYHDVATGLGDYLEKVLRHERMRRKWRSKYPDILKYYYSYDWGTYRKLRPSPNIFRRLQVNTIRISVLLVIWIVRILYH